jgi:hypothetical protein
MQPQPNTVATASLVCGLSLIVCFFGGMCMSFVPFVSLFVIVLMPIEWMLAIAGVVTGVLGYRASMARDGAGQVAAIVGGLISGMWILMQLLVWISVFVLIVGMFFLGGLMAFFEMAA